MANSLAAFVRNTKAKFTGARGQSPVHFGIITSHRHLGHLPLPDGSIIDLTPARAVAEGIPPQIIGTARYPRNKPCHCGSNKKFKRCHGRPLGRIEVSG